MIFGQKKPENASTPERAIEERVMEVNKVENAEDRRERALEELCRDNADFAVRLDQAIKIIHEDRVMFLQHSSIPYDQRPLVTYADSRKALLAMVARAGDHPVEGYKYVLEMAVQRVLSDGRRFKDPEAVAQAFLSYQNGRAV